LCALITAIVKGTEPTIQWDRAIYVIALKMLVMEVVGVAVGIHGARFSQLDLVKPGVAGGRSQAQVDQVINSVHWMGCNHPVQ
jgi:hypothetical protein